MENDVEIVIDKICPRRNRQKRQDYYNQKYLRPFMPSQIFHAPFQTSFNSNHLNETTLETKANIRPPQTATVHKDLNKAVPLTDKQATQSETDEEKKLKEKKLHAELYSKATQIIYVEKQLTSVCTQTFSPVTNTSSCQAVCSVQDQACQASASLQHVACQTTKEINTTVQPNINFSIKRDACGKSQYIILKPIGAPQVNNNKVLIPQENRSSLPLRLITAVGVASTDDAGKNSQNSTTSNPKLSTTAAAAAAHNLQQSSSSAHSQLLPNNGEENTSIASRVKREISKRRRYVKEEFKPKNQNFVDPKYHLEYKEDMYYHCKLCQFNKKKIVEHYVKSHPESEVFISRFGETVAKDAVNSVDAEPDDDFQLYCRICKYSTINMNKFFNHTTTHTGEYLYKCGYCNMKSSNLLNLKNHFSSEHFKHSSEKMQFKSHQMYKIDITDDYFLPGFICTGCNFVQLLLKNVEKHVQNFHPTSTTKELIQNINFARFDPAYICEPTATQEQSEENNRSMNNHVQQTDDASSQLNNLKRSSSSKETTQITVNWKRVCATNTPNDYVLPEVESSDNADI